MSALPRFREMPPPLPDPLPIDVPPSFYVARHVIRDWEEQFCRKGQDAPFIEFGLDEPVVVGVVFTTVDNGEDGEDVQLERVIPLSDIRLSAGEGRALVYPAAKDCLEFLPQKIVEQIAETVTPEGAI